MAVAGFCAACQQYVYLNEQWGCVNGHAWDQISAWYDPETGAQVTPYWLQPGYSPAPMPEPVPAAPAPAPYVAPAPAPAPYVAPAPAPAPVAAAPAPYVAPEPAPVPAAPAPADRLALLAAILEMMGRYPGYRTQYGTDTDIVIDNQIADASWLGGKKKIEYSAILKAVEPELTVYFWEVLKESGAGLSFGGMESESYSTFGAKRSGTTKEIVLGPGGVEVNAEWDYAATRKIIESVAAQNGWRVKTVLLKGAAQW
jgi:hypothetical protein